MIRSVTKTIASRDGKNALSCRQRPAGEGSHGSECDDRNCGDGDGRPALPSCGRLVHQPRIGVVCFIACHGCHAPENRLIRPSHFRNKRYARACSVQVESERAQFFSGRIFCGEPVSSPDQVGQAFAGKCSDLGRLWRGLCRLGPWLIRAYAVSAPVKADATSPARLVVNRPKLFSARTQAKISLITGLCCIKHWVVQAVCFRISDPSASAGRQPEPPYRSCRG